MAKKAKHPPDEPISPAPPDPEDARRGLESAPNPDLAREQDVDVPHELTDAARQDAEYPPDESDEG
jgi:hypothetical protein